jgi:hypothetical protein
VAKPLNILLVGLILFVAHCLLQRKRGEPLLKWHPLLAAAIGWGLYAVWDWLVLVQTPDANIRVDLLVIWPVLAVLTVWGVVRSRWPR